MPTVSDVTHHGGQPFNENAGQFLHRMIGGGPKAGKRIKLNTIPPCFRFTLFDGTDGIRVYACYKLHCTVNANEVHWKYAGRFDENWNPVAEDVTGMKRPYGFRKPLNPNSLRSAKG